MSATVECRHCLETALVVRGAVERFPLAAVMHGALHSAVNLEVLAELCTVTCPAYGDPGACAGDE